MADHMEPPAPAGKGGGLMVQIQAASVFDEVCLRVISETGTVFYDLSPLVAKLLARQLLKAARVSEKMEEAPLS